MASISSATPAIPGGDDVPAFNSNGSVTRKQQDDDNETVDTLEDDDSVVDGGKEANGSTVEGENDLPEHACA